MTTQTDVTDLVAAGAQLLEEARASQHRKASRLVVTGPRQRAVLIALTEGGELGEHDSPPAATFQVLQGRARLSSAEDEEWLVQAGSLAVIPRARHAVAALSDCVILLTISLQT